MPTNTELAQTQRTQMEAAIASGGSVLYDAGQKEGVKRTIRSVPELPSVAQIKATLDAVDAAAPVSIPSITNADLGKTLTVDTDTGAPKWDTPAGVGTVTSVGLSLPDMFEVDGSPITEVGQFDVNWAASLEGGEVLCTAPGDHGPIGLRALEIGHMPEGLANALAPSILAGLTTQDVLGVLTLALLGARCGDISLAVLDGTSKNVAFTSALPNANYQVFLTPESNLSTAMWASSKTTNGFTLNVASALSGTISYLVVPNS